MASSIVEGLLKQSKQQVCKHVILERGTGRGGVMFSYIVAERHDVVFVEQEKKRMIKTP